MWCLLQSDLDSLLPDCLELGVIMARCAVAHTRNAIETRSEALTVEFEAPGLATVAGLARDGLGLWHSVRGLLVYHGWVGCLSAVWVHKLTGILVALRL